MPRNESHELQLTPTAVQAARQRFVLALKRDLASRLRPALKQRVAASTLDGEDAERIREELEATLPRKVWSRLARSAQEMMWQAIAEPLRGNETWLQMRCGELALKRAAGGSLELDDAVQMPEAMRCIDVHLQPGGYALDRHEKDVLAGALYEAGGALYSQGQSIDTGESKAELVIRFLTKNIADFNPQRILDMGCSAGGSSTPYARMFPQAEVHAVDVAPAMLRYAHARAESIGVAVKFHQRDVVEVGFDDESFDLVVSHNAMHEMSPSTIRAMMRESYRLLRVGGIVVHQDVPLRTSELDAYAQADFSWDRLNNNEPYWQSYAEMDLALALSEAGFSEAVRHERVAQLGGSMSWDLFWACKE